MDRKEIVKALGNFFGVKPRYMGAPTFAYQVTAADETYTVDRTGRIVTSSGKEVTLESIIQKGIVEADLPVDPLVPPSLYEVTIPMEGHTAITLRNLVNLLFSKQTIIVKSLATGSVIVEESFVKALNDTQLESMDDFKGVLACNGTAPCPGIFFDFDVETITFNFLKGNPSYEKLQAYTHFVVCLNETAKKLKYTLAKPTVTDNPKFTLRLFLIRLGMVGEEYRTDRKLLLENLEGNSAFRNGK